MIKNIDPDPDEVLDVCSKEMILPKLWGMEEVHYVTEDMLRNRIQCFDWGTDREEEEEFPVPGPFQQIRFGNGFGG